MNVQKGVFCTGKKTYLSNQIKLVSLSTTDLFTEQEYALYKQIVDHINAIEEVKGDDEKVRKLFHWLEKQMTRDDIRLP